MALRLTLLALGLGSRKTVSSQRVVHDGLSDLSLVLVLAASAASTTSTRWRCCCARLTHSAESLSRRAFSFGDASLTTAEAVAGGDDGAGGSGGFP